MKEWLISSLVVLLLIALVLGCAWVWLTYPSVMMTIQLLCALVLLTGAVRLWLFE